jgi:hypothetical protein
MQYQIVDAVTARAIQPTRRAPINSVTLAWWREDSDEYRATHQERQRSKLGRMARLPGTAEAVELVYGALIGVTLPRGGEATERRSSSLLMGPYMGNV